MQRGFKSLALRNILGIASDAGGARILDEESFKRPGGLTEWPKVYDWKSYVLKGTKGSNP